jgi:hypothetical protein
MKAYWIDAGKREIREIDYEVLHEHFKGGIAIGATFDNGDVLYVDDEGLLRPATVAFRIRSRGLDSQPMMSDGALSGRDDFEAVDGGYVETTLPPAMSIADLEAEIEWLTVEEALSWFRARVGAPSVTVNGEPVAIWGEHLSYLEGKPFPGYKEDGTGYKR